MASITRDQAIKWNQGNQNGFKLDTQYFIFHNEKTSRKYIKVDDKQYLSVSISYRAESNKVKNEYGCEYYKYTGKYEPVLHMAIYHESDSGMMVSYGLGYWKVIADAQDKKNYNVIKNLTLWFNDENCLKIFEELKKTQVNQCV